ncbi:MAG: acyltransferase [Flavobacteriales bacterium]|jgi:peptidoglycan/LPS O-acetylase OafA/YrhL|nr:acyltransferase [Flavobacteriales bacterium]MBK7110992.1 acyltransferase [Flavobacteriales bacterium]MBK9628667.1 acyltransferase [Flavobacteriales bacterium]MBP8876961.1 acyltransferase [Flavobacteriales bacterium]MBP9176240.1 acyltransferase [Flavobacteriales bacterium]
MLNARMHLLRIDVLRAVAIGMVFLHHAQICLFPGYLSKTFHNGWLALGDMKDIVLNLGLGGFGWGGVHLFLLISGFLIHLGHLRDLDKGRKFVPRTFFSKRFWRIYPPYVLTLLFFCFSVNGGRYVTDPIHRTELLSHLFLVHNLSDATMMEINPSYWSIALEAQLYLFYPILLVARRRWGMGRAFGSIVLLGAIIQFANLLGLPGHWSPAYVTNVFAFWYIWAAGAFLAERYKADRRVVPFQIDPLLMAVLAWSAMIFCHLYQPARILTIPILVISMVAFFEWWLHMSIPSRLESSMLYKVLISIGLCSYSIYLIHQPYLRDLLNNFGRYGNEGLALVIKLAGVFVLLFLISHAFYLLVEQPSIAWGARLREANRKRSTTPR